MKNNTVLIEGIKDVMTSELANQTETGVVSGKFANTDEIKRELHATSVAKFFEVLKKKVADYYEGD